MMDEVVLADQDATSSVDTQAEVHSSSSGQGVHVPLLEERRVDPMLDDREVTFLEMCEGLQHLGLTEEQLQSHWEKLRSHWAIPKPPGQSAASSTSVTGEPAAVTATVAVPASGVDPRRQVVHDFLRCALADLDKEHLLLSFSDVLPDLLEEHPGRILAPIAGTHLLDSEVVEQIDQEKQMVLGVCVLDDDGIDEDPVRRILGQLGAQEGLVVFVALVVSSRAELDSDSVDRIMHQHDELLEMGADDVLVNPEMEPGFLRRAVRLMRLSHKSNALRAEQTLATEPLSVTPRKLQELDDEYHNLLWNSIPLTLMPYFPSCDRSIPVDSSRVGGYRFFGKFPAISGRVMCAATSDDKPIAVKTITKSDVQTASELEDIYREFRFLTVVLHHPNIPRCLDMLHTPKTLYMVLEYAGSENLLSYCRQCPGSRLDVHQALDCFKQVVSALGLMHTQHIVHRSVSLEHVVVDQRGEDSLHCTLIDFRTAVITHGDTSSSNVRCGSLPCVAPEVANSEEYIPRFVDSWSVGALLLEIAGGVGSLLLSACPDLAEDSPQCPRAIARFFRSRDCHARALSKMGGINSPEILGHLRRLVLVPQRSRMLLPDLDAELQNP